MVFCIHCVVLRCTLLRVSVVGAEGLMKSVSRFTCRSMPGGKVPVERAVSMMCLWCVACISLKYCLLMSLVSGSGAVCSVGWLNVVGCVWIDMRGKGVCECVRVEKEPFWVPLLCAGLNSVLNII